MYLCRAVKSSYNAKKTNKKNLIMTVFKIKRHSPTARLTSDPLPLDSLWRKTISKKNKPLECTHWFNFWFYFFVFARTKLPKDAACRQWTKRRRDDGRAPTELLWLPPTAAVTVAARPKQSVFTQKNFVYRFFKAMWT